MQKLHYILCYSGSVRVNAGNGSVLMQLFISHVRLNVYDGPFEEQSASRNNRVCGKNNIFSFLYFFAHTHVNFIAKYINFI
jgi:hypothetical protein